jgi:fructoselysine and glucoselysine-specific PTS system IIB component
MILTTRVDNRLLHGQTAIAWPSSIGADCILIANDDVENNSIRKATIQMAKPQGIKLVIKNVEDAIAAINSGITDKYKLFIIIDRIDDAYRLAEKCNQIKTINLGLTTTREGTRNISKNINITAQEKNKLELLISKNIEVEIRSVPNEHKLLVKNLL